MELKSGSLAWQRLIARSSLSEQPARTVIILLWTDNEDRVVLKHQHVC